MNLPEDFIKNTQPLLDNEWDAFESALKEDSPVSVRINKTKADIENKRLAKVPWSTSGYYLNKRPSFTFDPLFHAGAYYVQEASSMFIEQVFRQYTEGDIKLLDLCAAPGGKSTHMASIISPNSLLVSNEVIRSRANILSENITKAGYPNVIVTNNDPSDIGKLIDFFDVILVDAPCSGEGMFRKDPEASKEWSLSNVQLCMERQQRIVADIWKALKPGGILIYSTCTYNKEENENNIIWLRDNLGAKTLPLDTEPEWNISPSYYQDIDAYHFFPHKTVGEGFFIAALRKEGNEDIKKSSKINNRKRDKQKPTILPKEYQECVTDPNKYVFFDKGNSWFAFPSTLYNDFLDIIPKVKLVSAGIYIGEFKGKDFIPHHSLAMSIDINKNHFFCLEIDKSMAISYLKRDTLTFPELPKGYILLTYKNVPLGFIKNIGSRTNNLYPNDWRIRTTYLPQETDDFWQ